MGAGTSSAQHQLHGKQSASNTKEEKFNIISEKQKKPEATHKVQVIAPTADTSSEGGGSESRTQKGVPVKQMETRYSISFLNNKLWVDKDTGHNCKMLYARSLSITWSEEPRYWQWLVMEEIKEVEIEVASLLKVCWLEIHGKLDLCDLTPGVMYEIFFVVQLSEFSYGWHIPVNLRIKFPNGTVREHKESLQEKPRGQWLDLKVAQFMMHQHHAGEVLEVSLLECEGGQWKQGLMVKGVTVRPEKII